MLIIIFKQNKSANNLCFKGIFHQVKNYSKVFFINRFRKIRHLKINSRDVIRTGSITKNMGVKKKKPHLHRV